MKKTTRRNIIITLLVALPLLLGGLGSAGWWSWRRWFSPAIQPSEILYPTRGLDLSAHNGAIDFNAVRSSGISFVVLKATEGVTFCDAAFDRNYRAARAAGLKVGAYHFFRFDCDGRVQASHFLRAIKEHPLDLPPVIDIEESGNPAGHDDRDIRHNLASAIDHMQLRGINPIIYTNKGGLKRFIQGDFDDIPLWICSFTDPPGPDKWYLWQYTHRGSIPGIKGHVDINILNPAVKLDSILAN